MTMDAGAEILWFGMAFALVLSALVARRLPMQDWIKMAMGVLGGLSSSRLDNAMVRKDPVAVNVAAYRSEEHTSELQSLMRISYAVFCVKITNTTFITLSP